MRSHLGNNCWVHWQKLLFTHVLSKAKIPASAKSVFDLSDENPLRKHLTALRFQLKCKKMYNKILRWFKDKRKTSEFEFRFTGDETKKFWANFMHLIEKQIEGKILSSLRSFLYCPLAGWVFILATVCPWLVESLILTLVTFQSWSMSVNSILAELWRAKRACGAPWVSKSTHPRKFGNHVTVHRSQPARPSVRTTGKPMFNLTLSS